jgi:hypothetical protein
MSEYHNQDQRTVTVHDMVEYLLRNSPAIGPRKSKVARYLKLAIGNRITGLKTDLTPNKSFHAYTYSIDDAAKIIKSIFPDLQPKGKGALMTRRRQLERFGFSEEHFNEESAKRYFSKRENQ